MKKNKTLMGILLAAALFSGSAFNMQKKLDSTTQQKANISSIDSVKNKIMGTIKISQDILLTGKIITLGLFSVLAHELYMLPRHLGFYYAIDTLRLKAGSYLPTYMSYIKQIESELKLIKTEKDQKHLSYTAEDCFSDIVKIVNMYAQVGPITYGKIFRGYYRDREIKKRILEALVQKYELFLPENITKQDWIRYLKNNNFDAWQFKQLSKKYKDNQELQEAYESILSENITKEDWIKYIQDNNLTDETRQELWKIVRKGDKVLQEALNELLRLENLRFSSIADPIIP
ncbi:MAG TPA: hypothetical protein VKU36_04645 [Candidatus Babeliales bacterium]|nr:hypothetical protein [Candidatus Babeliales bacterium]